MSYTDWFKTMVADRIVGHKIVAAELADDGEIRPLLTLENGTLLWINSDEEGNDGGFIEVNET